ncbi:MAG: hypothetical protein ACK44A_15755 [Roseateles sp.]
MTTSRRTRLQQQAGRAGLPRSGAGPNARLPTDERIVRFAAGRAGDSTELQWRGGKLPLKLAAGQTARFERRDGRLQRL